MHRSFFTALDQSGTRRPNREQNLLIAPSKHIYAMKDGTLKYQKKALEPKLAGARKILTRFIVLDVDTGLYYGELHDASDSDLLGFLARAWMAKPDHAMRGIPGILNLPRLVHSNASFVADLEQIRSVVPLSFGELPSGFAAGAHAAKSFENEVNGFIWRGCTLTGVQSCSAVLSASASVSALLWGDAWKHVAPPPDEFGAMAGVNRPGNRGGSNS